MNTENLKSLKKMITFDFLNLYKKEDFRNWLSEKDKSRYLH